MLKEVTILGTPLLIESWKMFVERDGGVCLHLCLPLTVANLFNSYELKSSSPEDAIYTMRVDRLNSLITATCFVPKRTLERNGLHLHGGQ